MHEHAELDALVAAKPASVLLYPSSCGYSADFQRVPFDAVILNSRDIKRHHEGKVYCLSYDNNELLGLLYRRKVRVTALLVIRDDCVEGGNPQCVVGDGFFGRLMPITSPTFQFFCDHYRTLDIPAQFADVDGRLDQIQLSLGHASIQTSERYSGVTQDLQDAPCDHLGLRLE